MESESFQSWKSRWIASLLDPFIMKIIDQKPCWGGEIIDLAKTHLDPEVKVPTIYATLSRLEKGDLIASSKLTEVEGITRGIPRKYYKLGKLGKFYLEKLNDQIKNNLVILDADFSKLINLEGEHK